MCHPENDTGTPTADADERQFTIETGGIAMPVFEAVPAETSRGNVLIIHDIYGAGEFYQDLARRFASVGFTAWLPDLFVRQGGLEERTREAASARAGRFSYPQALDDLREIVSAFGDAHEGGIGTVGFCMGGTLVMLLAAREPRLAAGVVYYGFPANTARSDLRPFEPLQEAGDIQTPLLGFWGDQDHGVGIDNVERYREALAAAGKEHDFTIYPGLPHGFLTFDEASANYESSLDSWRKTLAFYDERLTSYTI